MKKKPIDSSQIFHNSFDISVDFSDHASKQLRSKFDSFFTCSDGTCIPATEICCFIIQNIHWKSVGMQ